MTGQPELFADAEVVWKHCPLCGAECAKLLGSWECTGCGEWRQARIPYRGEAPHNGTATSVEAAESVEPVRGSLQWRVWRYVNGRDLDGATAQEIERGLGLSGNTVRPRLRELEAMQLIQKTNRTRETASGRKATVYVAG
jgi:hypothetical protein